MRCIVCFKGSWGKKGMKVLKGNEIGCESVVDSDVIDALQLFRSHRLSLSAYPVSTTPPIYPTIS